MKAPNSGSPNPVASPYIYGTSIQRIREMPEFTRTGSSAYSDTYFDIGEARPVMYSSASNSSGVAWVWSPGTALTHSESNGQNITHNSLIVGYLPSSGSPSESTLSGMLIERYTRPGICWTGSQFLVGYVEAGGSRVVVRPLNTSNLTLGSIVAETVLVDIPNRKGMTVEVFSTSSHWISFVRNGHLHAGHSGTVYTVKLTSDSDLKWWHHTSFRVAKSGDKHIFYYQHRPGMGVSRLFHGDYVGSPVPILGGDHEYAYQFIRVTGISNFNNRYWAILERGIYNSDDTISSWFTTVAYSVDGLHWADWCGAFNYPIRGCLNRVGSKLWLTSVGHVHSSDSVRLTGAIDWTEVGGVSTYNTMFQSNSTPSSLQVQVVHDPIEPSIRSGDTLRTLFFHNGGDYTLAMANVDIPQEDYTYVGQTDTVSARGPIKFGTIYQATVDEAFDSGITRFDNFDVLSVVPKMGTWQTKDGLLRPGEDDEGYPSIAVIPEMIQYDPFHFMARFDKFENDSGLVFFLKDKYNYWFFGKSGNNHVLGKFEGDAWTLVGSWEILSGDSPCYMIQFTAVGFICYVARPLASIEASGIPHSVEFRYLAVVNAPGSSSGKFSVGFRARSKCNIEWSFLRQGYWQWTIGQVAAAIGTRAGMQTSLMPLIDEFPNWTTHTSPWVSSKIIRHMDIEFDVQLTAGALKLSLGTRGNSMYMGGISVELSRTIIKLFDVEYSAGSGAGTPKLRSSLPLSPGRYIENGSRIRVCILQEPLSRYSCFQVFCNNELVWTLPLLYTLGPGQIGIHSEGGLLKNLKAYGLGYPVDTHVWPYGSTALGQIRQIVGSSLWSLVEKNDMTTMLVPVDFTETSTGTLDDTTLVMSNVPDDSTWASIIKVEGAEVIGYYTDPRLLKYGIRPYETSAPHLWTESECIDMAKRHADLLYSRRQTKSTEGYLDPRIELLDKIEIDGESYVVERIVHRVNSPRSEPMALMSLNLRKDAISESVLV